MTVEVTITEEPAPIREHVSDSPFNEGIASYCTLSPPVSVV